MDRVPVPRSNTGLKHSVKMCSVVFSVLGLYCKLQFDVYGSYFGGSYSSYLFKKFEQSVARFRGFAVPTSAYACRLSCERRAITVFLSKQLWCGAESD